MTYNGAKLLVFAVQATQIIRCKLETRIKKSRHSGHDVMNHLGLRRIYIRRKKESIKCWVHQYETFVACSCSASWPGFGGWDGIVSLLHPTFPAPREVAPGQTGLTGLQLVRCARQRLYSQCHRSCTAPAPFRPRAPKVLYYSTAARDGYANWKLAVGFVCLYPQLTPVRVLTVAGFARRPPEIGIHED